MRKKETPLNAAILFPGAVANTVMERLKKSADTDRALQVQRYFRETVRSFGVGAPEIHALAREMHEATRRQWTISDAISLCDLLFPRPELEAKSVAALILLRHQKQFPLSLFHKARGWLLREAGKRDMGRLEKFLLANGPALPRTTLRYAIERFPENKRRQLLLRTRAGKR
jgi:hypothetical protein